MIIYYSAIFSLLIQLITGGIDTWGLTLSLPNKHLIFRDILTVELSVQFVEAIFYIWLVGKIKSKDTNITVYRYFDWFITTPTMLITLMAYLNHNKQNQSNTPKKEYRIWDFFKEYQEDILVVIILNALMLLIGLSGELGLAPLLITTTLGFIPFITYFRHIWNKFVANQPGSQLGHFKIIFWYFVGFWSLYGVAAILPHTPKNVMYNILDIFAKNILGVILVYIIWNYHRGHWN